MRVLVAEDDAVLANGLNVALCQAGYTVDHTDSGLEADEFLTQDEYDLVVLDLGLPYLDGLEVLKRLRSRKKDCPVLVLTARDSLEDRVTGLDAGADDYLVKPFKLPELEARLRALTRRAHFQNQSMLYLGKLRFDPVGRRVHTGDQPLDLSAREMDVLELLLRHQGKVVSKTRFIDNLCGWQEAVTINAIEVYVSRLRKKLEGYGLQFRTIRGIGYLLETLPEVEVDNDSH